MAHRREVNRMSVLGRIVRSSNGGYAVVELQQDKQNSIIDFAIERNLEILLRCLKAVSRWYNKHDLIGWSDYEKDFVIALFNSVSLKVTTLMALELSKQIRASKEGREG